MKRLLGFAAAVLVAAALTGCQQTVASIEEDARFVKACEDNGGDAYKDGLFGTVYLCDLGSR